MRVIVTGGRTPFALHLSRLFHTAGHDVVLTDSLRFSFGRFTRMKEKFVRTASARFEPEAFERDLLALVEAERPDMVVPSCEEIFYVADILARAGKRELLFAPPLDLLMAAHDKATFAELATRLGVGAPCNITLDSVEAVRDFAHDPGDFVFKPVYSRFASRVLISPDRAALEQIAPTPEHPWLAQARVDGEELCAYVVAGHGRIVASAVYRNLMRVGTGTSVCYEPTDCPQIEEFLVRFAATAGWHGQISFDAILRDDGSIVVIEANPRATSGVSLFAPSDGLVEAMTGQMSGVRPSPRRLSIKGTVFLVGVLGWIGLTPRQPWLGLFLSSRNAFAFPGESALLHGQTLSVAELWLLSMRKGCSILEAATRDMEWNGEPLGRKQTSDPDPPGDAID